MDRYSSICPICNRKISCGLTRHHVKPKRQGGWSTPENSFYTCRDCHNIIDRIGLYNRKSYVKTVLKMFKLLHKQYPDTYTKNYTKSLLWRAYGITLYEINVYCLIDYIKEYKGDTKHLYNKLSLYNQIQPENNRFEINYYFMEDEIRIDRVTFAITTGVDVPCLNNYNWNDIK